MKKLFTLIVIAAFTMTVFAQAPRKMSYQAVVRNTAGELIVNQAIGLKVSILQGSTSGEVVFSETYNPNPQTNANGLLTIEIGEGTPIVGSLGDIDWAAGPFFLKTEADPAGGTNYSISGTSQLLSVPYALYAGSAGNAFSGDWAEITGKPTTLSGYGITDADGSETNELQSLSLSGTQLTLSDGGGTVTLPSTGGALSLPYSGSTSEGTYAFSVDHTSASESTYGGMFFSEHGTGLLAASNGGTGLFGRSDSPGGVGVFGMATATEGEAYGVYGTSESTGGTGVHGAVHTLEGINYGVRGEVASDAGYSGYFEGGRFYVEGDVGIGTTSPEHKLHVNGLARFDLPSGQISISTPGGWPGLITYSSNGHRRDIVYNNDGMFLSASASTSAPSALNGIVLRENGNIGIGIADPGQNLDVSGQIRIRGGNPESGKVLTSDANGVATWTRPGLSLPFAGTVEDGDWGISIEHMGSSESYGGIFKSSSTAGVGLYGHATATSGTTFGGEFRCESTNGAGVFGEAVASSGTAVGVQGLSNSPDGYSGYFVGGKFCVIGNMGIGTSSPAYQLDITGQVNLNKGISSGPALRCNGAEALWYNGIYFSWGYGTNDTYNYFARKVGIGTNADPGANLLVVNGAAAKPGGGSWSTWSDERLKDIYGTYAKGLNEITELRPVNFSYRKGNPVNLPDDRIYTGLVAQEVQKVFPEAVTEGGDGYLQLDIHPVNIALINAVKELNDEINSLEYENDRLKSENEQINARLSRLEKLLEKNGLD
jgi:hypothetical protein